jgi:hypothetical protein
MRHTDPAHEAYYRLLDAQREVTPHELAEMAKQDAENTQRNRIRRKLPKVY